MVVKNRGTAAPPVERTKGAERGSLPPLEAALLAGGFARTPAEARVLARSLVAALRAAGVSAPQGASPHDVLGAFQGLQGLPVTGFLDDATAQKLIETGLLRRPDAPLRTAPAPRRDPPGADVTTTHRAPGAPKDADVLVEGRPGFAEMGLWSPLQGGEGRKAESPGTDGRMPTGEPAFVVQHEQMRARAELKRDAAPRDLSGLLENLALLGFQGAGRGAQRLESAVRSFQTQHGVPPTGRLDAATVAALVERGALPPGTETLRTASDTPASSPSAMAGAPTTGTLWPVPPAGEGTPLPLSAPVAPPGGELGSDQILWSPEERNAPAGEDDAKDPRRGHATLHEDVHDDESYYELPSLHAQVFHALNDIESDGGVRGVPTYSWDVTLYRPGIYGRRQPAEAVLHIVVERAASLDPVWQEARDALAARLAELEPTSLPPSNEDFTNALRRARARARSPF